MPLKWGGLQPVYVTTMHKSPAPSFVLAGEFYRFINPIYAEFLKVIDIDPEKALRFELHGFKAYECPNERCGVGGLFIPIVSCGRYHPHVSRRHTSRCVARLVEKIEFLEKSTTMDYLVKLDLTVPGWVSKSLRPGDLKLIRRAVNIFLDRLRSLLFRHDSRLGGFYAVHIWKTTKPLEPWLHVHLNLLNVAYDPRQKTFHRFKPFVDHYKVKIAWRESLVAVGLWDNPLARFLPDCHVGYIRLSDRARVVHRIRYVFRKPVVDINKSIGNCDWRNADPVWARHLLDYTPRQVCVGWALNLKRFGFVAGSYSGNSTMLCCPCCGGSLEYVGRFPEIPPEIPWFSIDPGGGLVETAPL